MYQKTTTDSLLLPILLILLSLCLLLQLPQLILSPALQILHSTYWQQAAMLLTPHYKHTRLWDRYYIKSLNVPANKQTSKQASKQASFFFHDLYINISLSLSLCLPVSVCLQSKLASSSTLLTGNCWQCNWESLLLLLLLWWAKKKDKNKNKKEEEEEEEEEIFINIFCLFGFFSFLLCVGCVFFGGSLRV